MSRIIKRRENCKTIIVKQRSDEIRITVTPWRTEARVCEAYRVSAHIVLVTRVVPVSISCHWRTSLQRVRHIQRTIGCRNLQLAFGHGIVVSNLGTRSGRGISPPALLQLCAPERICRCALSERIVGPPLSREWERVRVARPMVTTYACNSPRVWS